MDASIVLVTLWALLLLLMAIAGALLLGTLALRSRAEGWEANRQQTLRRAEKIQQHLPTLAQAFEPEFGEPYAPHYRAARQTRQALAEALKLILDDRARHAATALPAEPLRRLWRITPLINEWQTRWQWRAQTRALAAQWAAAEAQIAELERVLGVIGALGHTAQATLNAHDHTARALQNRINAERREARPLTYEAARLKEAGEALDDVRPFLADTDPPKSKVVAAHPLLTRVGEELRAIEQALTQVQSRREQAEAALKAVEMAQADLVNEFAEAAQAGAPVPRWLAVLEAQRARRAALRQPVARGEYDVVLDKTQALLVEAQALEEQFNELQTTQQHTRQACLAARKALEPAQLWVAELSPRYELDVTAPALRQWEADLTRAEAGSVAEALTEVQSALKTAQAIRERVQASQAARHELKTRLPTAEQQRQKLAAKLCLTQDATPTLALVRRAEIVATELRHTHPNYWAGLNPQHILDTAHALPAQWTPLNTAPKESALNAWLDRLKALYDQVYTLEQDVEKAERACRKASETREKTLTRLNDPQLLRALALGERMIEGIPPEMAQTLKAFHVTHRKLLAKLDEPVANYDQHWREADDLHKAVLPVMRQLQAKLDETTSALAQVDHRLRGRQSKLEDLLNDPVLEFAPAANFYAELTEWRQRLPNASTTALSQALAQLADGQRLLEALEPALQAMRSDRQRFNDERAALLRAIHQAHTALDSVQALFDKHQPIWNSQRWPEANLEPLRQPLDEAERRLRRFERGNAKTAFAVAARQLTEMGGWADDACDKAARAQKQWVYRWGEVEDQRRQLERAIERGRLLTGAAQNRWENIYQRNLLNWEQRLARARSFREAQDFLNAALIVADNFFRSLGLEG
jgi:hypothetical protein